MSGIKLIEYGDEKFKALNTMDKLFILEEAEQTIYENKMALQRQLARIQELQYILNEKQIVELEEKKKRRDEVPPPIQVTFVPDNTKERERKRRRADAEGARQRAEEAGLIRETKRSKFNK